ncbi:hypothetical protein [Vibrio coralliirubri]|uniref:hypothetical protein n=1 Tax=Vibrio coralliirubri TaxID=1516159 RepID=UPI0006320136|nr:hypothetical protein [Vibrio coralliirubri]CDU14909.1 exported hypothetical protein [Vibrio coralliirubri]
MKRMILASLISLLSSDALASDLTYGGPYSQMKLKLCSDTPPSRSILPDGSLVCDGEENDPNAYCVGGFNYADSDIFNCGSDGGVDSNDLNGNGIRDEFEDWDGDGMNNGEDPDPYTPDNPITDENGDGIPDELASVYDDLVKTQEILFCNTDDEQCQYMRSVMNKLASNNAALAGAVRDASLRNVRRNDFNQSVGTLTSTVNSKTNAILSALDSIDVSSADNSAEIADLKSFLNDRVSETSYMNLSKIDSLEDDVSNVYGKVSLASNDAYYNRKKLDELSTKLDSGSSGGLTSQQKTQLKNAAKASANQRKINALQETTNTTLSAVATQAGRFSILEGKFDTVTGQFQALDGQFSQLNYKLDNLDVGDVNVDLSSVENGLVELGEKIDGLESGGDGEALAEISGKLDGVGDGLDDIGDLLKGVDASKAGINGTCIQGGTCQGFYDSAYEGDLSDVLESQLQTMKTSVVDPFVSNFGNIDLSSAKRPNFGLPVPFYGYFSFDDYIDLDWIFGFLRFIFLASTAFYCRQIIFGG